ncbi:hypothetical protein E0198_004895 [Clavispora lusitaniae]|nr:hypothetical protein E0198_004895 [Clavispora lusitaniae]
MSFTAETTKDRILSTDVDASWKYSASALKSLDNVITLADKGVFDQTYDTARKVTLDLFALENSPSVQATMYNMASLILSKAPAVESVTYVLPNKHYILYNLEWKGIKDNTELFYPSPDPNGLIKCTVGRKTAKL